MNNLHFKAVSGWINDPNGLCFFKGQYHIFYQYFPYDLKWGTMHWGHATTKDFIHYEHHPIALFPSITADQNGVFSGSALIEDEQMHLFFTGVKYNNFASDIHRCGDELFESRQLKISSSDGFRFDNFTGKTVIIDKLERPVADPIHTRDPKVWKKDGKYYLLLGSNTLHNSQQQGALLFFESDDLLRFTHLLSYSQSDMGHMWECPNYFEIQDQAFVVMSPEGTMPDCEYSSHVYIARASFNYKDSFELQEPLKLIDIGLDCYAPQSFEDEKGRRVLISWLRMPEAIEENTIGCFTMPRVLEYEKEQLTYKLHPFIDSQFEEIEAIDQLDPDLTYKLSVLLDEEDSIKIGNYSIKNENGRLSFDRTEIFPIDDEQLKVVTSSEYTGPVKLEIYIDGYVIESFINDGEEVCSQVIYDSKKMREIVSTVSYHVFKMKI